MTTNHPNTGAEPTPRNVAHIKHISHNGQSPTQYCYEVFNVILMRYCMSFLVRAFVTNVLSFTLPYIFEQ